MTNLMLRDPVTNLLPILARQTSPLLQNPWGIDNGLVSTFNGPAVTVYETKDEYVFQAELPGWTRDQISIDYENQTLTLSGARELPQDANYRYHRVERFYGQFSRSFTLPATVDTTRAGAELKDGVLTVHLPKHEQAKPRQIEVKTVQ